MKYRHLKIGGCLLLFACVGVTIRAEDEPLPGRVEIEVGGFFVTKIDTRAQLERKFGPVAVGTIIDLDQDLGLAESKTVPRIDGVYRLNKRHSISFSWWNIERDAAKFLGKDIDFGDISIPIGETVEAYFDTQTVRVSYGYSFYNVPKAEIGINAGLHVTSIDVGLSCLTCSSAGAVERESVTAPLPVLGFHFRYQMSPRWSFTGYTQHFLLDYGDFEGSLTDTRLSFSHHTFKNVGFGFGWNRIESDIDVDTSDYFLAVGSKLDGVQAYVVVYAGKFNRGGGKTN